MLFRSSDRTEIPTTSSSQTRTHTKKIQRAGEGYDLASAIARLEAGDTSIKAKTMIYTEGTELENLPKDIMTMHEKAEAAAETMEQLKQVQQTEKPKPEKPEEKEEVKENE